MKKLCAFILGLCLYGSILAQTFATDFTANDCLGNPHNLFTELDNGKVIVIAWVMPCGGCSAGALAAHNAVQSFETSHPNTVSFYLVDDYANSTCATINQWGNTNSLTNATKFSDASISMSAYGVNGMPKVVVLGGDNHLIAYNQNNLSILQLDIQQAIASFLVNENDEINFELNVSVTPNPASKELCLEIDLIQKEMLTVKLFSLNGTLLINESFNDLHTGKNKLQISLDSNRSGTYLLQVSTLNSSKTIKVDIE